MADMEGCAIDQAPYPCLIVFFCCQSPSFRGRIEGNIIECVAECRDTGDTIDDGCDGTGEAVACLMA